jgi:hypothetical protein
MNEVWNKASKHLGIRLFELDKLLSELDGQGGYFIDFISTRGMQASIIRLHPGENDTGLLCY